jgi:hypothetical protein
MPADYYSDRVRGPAPRISEEVGRAAWGGLVALVHCRTADNSFARNFPAQCPDGGSISDTNTTALGLRVVAEIPDLSWPVSLEAPPPTLLILDLLEFLYRHISKPEEASYHSFYRHYHLKFDEQAGKDAFRAEVSGIFARNGIAYELGPAGQISRLGPEGLQEALRETVFRTGDTNLNSMLEAARSKFLDPHPTVRREALEKLWDAWERIKTLEMPGQDNKKESVTRLLDRAASESKFRQFIEAEAKVLTDAGNTFQIRHSEVHQTPLEANEHVDYMFHRLFGLIRLVLKRSGRGG